MKNKLKSYYIKQIIRALKENGEYNGENLERLYKYINSHFNYDQAPHVMCKQLFSFVLGRDVSKLKKYYINIISHHYIDDIKKYLKNHKCRNETVTDDIFKYYIEEFKLFYFLRRKFSIGEPSSEEWKMIFYNGQDNSNID